MSDLLWIAFLVFLVAGVGLTIGPGPALIVLGVCCGFLALATSDGNGIFGRRKVRG